MIAIGTKPLPDLVLRTAKGLNTQPNGTVTVSNNDGTVVSVQPNGTVETRPAGSAGAFEQATIDPHGLAFCPDGQHVYVLAYIEKLPNV